MIANGSRNIMEYEIPFNRPCLSGNELKYIEAALRDFHISGDGVFSKKCSAYLEERIGVPKVLLTTSCTHALEMCALLLDIQPGDEVIVPSFAFVTTANAFVMRGARPVFIDVRPDTLNLDETQLERLITARTKIIVALHYAGVGCEMDAIHAIAGQYKIAVVEDNAHGLFGRYKGRNLGTFGCLATLSFHETKNITCGEGGALLLNDEKYFERAEILREKGTNRSQFFRVKLINTPGLTLARAIFPPIFWRHFSWPSWNLQERFKSRERESGNTTPRNLLLGLRKSESGFHGARLMMNILTICFICCVPPRRREAN